MDNHSLPSDFGENKPKPLPQLAFQAFVDKHTRAAKRIAKIYDISITTQYRRVREDSQRWGRYKKYVKLLEKALDARFDMTVANWQRFLQWSGHLFKQLQIHEKHLERYVAVLQGYKDRATAHPAAPCGGWHKGLRILDDGRTWVSDEFFYDVAKPI